MYIYSIGNALAQLTLVGIISLTNYYFISRRETIKKSYFFILLVLVGLTFAHGLIKSTYTDHLMSTNWNSIDFGYSIRDEGIFSQASSDRSNGYPIILSIIFRFSHDYMTIFIFNIIMASVNVLIFYILLLEIFKIDLLALVGAFVYAFDYNIIQYAFTADPNPSYFFFMMMSFFFIFRAIKTKEPLVVSLAVLYLMFTASIRYEFIVSCLAFSAYLLFKMNHRVMRSLLITYILFSFIVLVPVILFNRPLLIHDSINDYPTGYEALTLEKTTETVPVFFKESYQVLKSFNFLLIIMAMGLVSSFKIMKRYRLQLVLILLWFIFIIMPYLFTRMDVKYYMLSYLPVLITLVFLTYHGFLALAQKFRNLIFLYTFIALILLLWSFGSIRSNLNGHQESVELFKSMQYLPANAKIVGTSYSAGVAYRRFGSFTFQQVEDINKSSLDLGNDSYILCVHPCDTDLSNYSVIIQGVDLSLYKVE